MDKEFFEIANRLGACRLLHGTENKEELMRLLLTPQGTEFCTKNNFPSMVQLRIIGKTKSTNIQNEKYKKIAFTHFSNDV